MVGSPKALECNCSSNTDIYITSLIEQVHYVKEENKMENYYSFFGTPEFFYHCS